MNPYWVTAYRRVLVLLVLLALWLPFRQLHAVCVEIISVTAGSDTHFFPIGDLFDAQPSTVPATNPLDVGSGTLGNSFPSVPGERVGWIDFGANYADITITEVWSAWRFFSTVDGLSNFDDMWWDPNKDAVKDGPDENGFNFFTVATTTVGDARWTRDATGLNVTPSHRYLMVQQANDGDRVSDDRGGEILFVSSVGGGSAWTSTTSGNWSTGGNWDAAPSDGDTLSFNATGTITATNDDHLNTVDDLVFSSGAGTYTLAGSGADPSITLNGDIHVCNSNTQTIDSTLPIALSAAAHSLDVDSGNLVINSVISGTGDITVSGSNTLTLGGTSANTFTGNVTVSGGTLLLSKTAGVDAIGDLAASKIIQVNSGATLQLGADNQIHNNNDLTLNGGTFHLDGSDETLNNLTLTSDSVINMDGGNSVLTFAGSSINLGSFELSIWNWDGNPTVGGGNDQLIFSGDTLTFGELDQIRFYADDGVTPWFGSGLHNNIQLAGGEVVPTPEASTYLSALGLLLLAYFRKRRWLCF